MAERFFRQGELPLILLALLEARPAHAWDLLGQLTQLLQDRHDPSPGAVYPAVKALEEAGLVAGHDEGRRTVLSLTAAGRKCLRDRRAVLVAFQQRTGIDLLGSASVDEQLDLFAAEVRRVAPHLGAEAVLRVLTTAQERLRRLAERQDGARSHA